MYCSALFRRQFVYYLERKSRDYEGGDCETRPCLCFNEMFRPTQKGDSFEPLHQPLPMPLYCHHGHICDISGCTIPSPIQNMNEWLACLKCNMQGSDCQQLHFSVQVGGQVAYLIAAVARMLEFFMT